MSDPGTVPNPHMDWTDIWEFGSNHQVRAALTAQLYRYVRRKPFQDECQEVRDHSYVPTFGGTWLSPDRYDSAAAAKAGLALPELPEHRIGPFWSLDVVFDGISLRASPPRFGEVGGGWELTTTRRIPFGERHKLT